MNATQLTDTPEFKNFVFVEPEPTPDDLAQAGVATREDWFTKRHAMHGDYETQKLEAFTRARDDARMDEWLKKEAGAAAKAEAQDKQEHLDNVSKRNDWRMKEYNDFKETVERTSTALAQLVSGMQEHWTNLGLRELPPTPTIAEMKNYARTQRFLDNLPKECRGKCVQLDQLLGAMAKWPFDLKTTEVMTGLQSIIAQLRAACPTMEELNPIRERIDQLEKLSQIGYPDFDIRPMMMATRKTRGGKPPYDYHYVASCNRWGRNGYDFNTN